MWVYANADVGRKNITFGIALFLILGVVVGIPLTIDFFGGSTLGDQYQVWKVAHGYAVFLSFINYFFGLTIDRWNLTRAQKETASWSFLAAGVVGGLVRPLLILTSTLDSLGIYVSLFETVFLTLGTVVVVIGQIRGRRQLEKPGTQARPDTTPYGSPHGAA